ncbi:TPA: phage coat protein, partial [Clostridioides difficile]|nr:phage coat protein [Clostridioides difficile]HBF0403492.1 phage coat protein [Clostridioides difficile]
ISYEKKKQVSLSPTKSELEDGSNWTLVNDGATTKTKYIDHKSIAIAQIISKG